jgi:DNA-binding NarL/FixJ family response regulator
VGIRQAAGDHGRLWRGQTGRGQTRRVGAAVIRVMVVDDEPGTLGRVEAIVGAEPGFTVVGTAPDGAAALELASELQPDMIVIGIDSLRSLVPEPVTKHVPSTNCTARETEVLGLVARGANNPEICEQLHISDATVRSHLYHLRAKLEARSRAELVVRAFELGLG